MARLTRDHLAGGGRARGTEVVELEDGDVVVRALIRDEAIAVQELTSMGDRDNLIIALGMVDPTMTVDDVGAWAASAPAGEISKVSTRIGQMSGMLEDSGKAAYKSTGRRRGAGV